LRVTGFQGEAYDRRGTKRGHANREGPEIPQIRYSLIQWLIPVFSTLF
jgi:hypothetical protein